PGTNITGWWRNMGKVVGLGPFQENHGIEAVGCSHPAQTPAGHPSNFPGQPITLAQLFLAIEQQSNQRSVDVPKTKQTEIIGMSRALPAHQTKISSRFHRKRMPKSAGKCRAVA